MSTDSAIQSSASAQKPNGSAPARHSLLELAPLELDCMNGLWLLGEGTVRDIRGAIASRRPRAYTTIMTIMDRLAKKGIVGRRRVHRAWLYRANLTKDAAREHAIRQVLDNFFNGSTEALLAQLADVKPAEEILTSPPSAPIAIPSAAPPNGSQPPAALAKAASKLA